MKHGAIISRAESLQILKNDLRKAALAKQAAELAKATAEDRQKMLSRIDAEIEQEVRHRATRFEPYCLLH